MFRFCQKGKLLSGNSGPESVFLWSTVGHSFSAAPYLLHLLGYRRGFKVLAIGGWFG
jgi:hypothetical protein